MLRRRMMRPLLVLAILTSSCFAASDLRLTLPPVWYAVPGTTVSLYFDNLVLTEHPEDYTFEVKAPLGHQDLHHWTATPTDRQVGEHAMEVLVKNKDGKVLDRAATMLRVAPANAGKDRHINLLIVGDSLTHASVYPTEIARLLNAPGNPTWKMLGTHKPAGAGPSVAHEGYGGWKWVDFLAKFAPKSSGETAGPLARKSTSPFIFADEQGKPQFDLQRYFRESCNQQTPDVVTFLLGINDCFGANPDDPVAMLKHIDGVLDNADKLLTAFHKAAPNAVLAVGLTTPPNSRESGFKANYKDKYHRWGWKRIQHRLVERMMERLSNRKAENIMLVPTELNLDPVAGYPENNGVHPNAVGYAQIGTSFYAWMKSWLAASK